MSASLLEISSILGQSFLGSQFILNERPEWLSINDVRLGLTFEAYNFTAQDTDIGKVLDGLVGIEDAVVVSYNWESKLVCVGSSFSLDDIADSVHDYGYTSFVRKSEAVYVSCIQGHLYKAPSSVRTTVKSTDLPSIAAQFKQTTRSEKDAYLALSTTTISNNRIALPADILENDINPMLDVASRMALGQTSKALKLMTDPLNRISNEALIPLRQSCNFALKVQLSNSGYGLFKHTLEDLYIHAPEALRNQATCLKGYLAKISQFDYVFDDLLIRLPSHGLTDEIKAVEDELLTLLERLFKHKKHFNSVTVKVLFHINNTDSQLDSRTEKRLFQMMSGCTINFLKLKFNINSIDRFSGFAVQSTVLKLSIREQNDARVYDAIQEFTSLRSLSVNNNINSSQLFNILVSIPTFNSLSVRSELLPEVYRFDNIKHISVGQCMQALTSLPFKGLESLLIGSDCIWRSWHLSSALKTNQKSLSKLSFEFSPLSSINSVKLSLKNNHRNLHP